MNKRKTLKKTIFILLVFSALLTILSLFVWKILYLNPREVELLKQRKLIKEEFLTKDYDAMKN